MLQLGYKAGPEQFPPTELLEYAIDAEKAGFDSIDVSDHFNPWSEEGQAAFTWTWLGAVASHTTRIHMGTGITCPILRYHPSIIAQAAATLSCFAPGRTYLAVGTGEALNEYAATGMWPEYEEREERLIEAIELIHKLWSGAEVTFEGKYYQTKKARLFTPPAAPIPLYYSALVPRSAEKAGKYGDGIITVGGKQPDLYKQILKNFENGARQAGKNPANMPKLIELNVEYTDDLETAIEYQQKYWAGSYIPALFDQKIYTPAMAAENGQVVGPDTIKKSACVSANADDHIKFASQYIELGFNQLFFHSAHPDQRTFLERYAHDVLPSLRQKGH
jgi:coenzyme F420-dependent glucose-6-phosphate dehydrogenase